ncbi:MAG: FAD-binding protein [Alphaproteobacteria bacterium]|nr:FAD-binding protein [Alphaproteobacteria bacterium]
MDQFAPSDEGEIIDFVRAAIANEAPLEVAGNATKAALGRPVEADRRLSTRSLRGIHFYEPSELVVSLGPGTTMRELTDLLDQNGQELAFEPIDYAHLFATEPLGGTIGSAVAVNASGPRRIKAGAARDHVLGFSAVSGRGEAFQSGGRVMKNVTGYDLSKLMTGSYGTLAILTDLTLKVLPKPEMEQTLLLHGLGDQNGIDVMTEASGLPHEVSSLAHLPAGCVAAIGPLAGQTAAVTALRIEGPETSVAKRKADLQEHFAPHRAEFSVLSDAHSKTFWGALRDCLPLCAHASDIWRLSTAPTEGARLVETIRKSGVDAAAYYDWAGGLVWLATTTNAETAAPEIRRALHSSGGHATLIRADASSRAGVDVFHPQPTALAALTARIKNSFDPERILNRGRMRKDF